MEKEFKNTFEYLDNVGIMVTDKIMDMIQRDNKVASGRLLNSIDYDIKGDTRGFELVVEYIDYGKFVLSGRKKGGRLPPVKEIEKWLRIKMVPIGGGRKRGFSNIEKMSWGVAKNIQKKGIKPYNFLKPLDSYIKGRRYKKGFELAMKKDIDIQVSKMTKKI